VPGRAPGSSRSHDGDSGSLQYVSWKRDPSPRFFPSKGTYRRKGIVRGGASWPHHGAVWPGAGPRPCGEPGSWPPSVSSPSHDVFQRLIKQSQSFETSHATAKITKHTIKTTSIMACKSLSRSLNKLLFVPLPSYKT
jgi:hypothetical protein